MDCLTYRMLMLFFFFFQAEDGIRDLTVTGVQTCALPISRASSPSSTGSNARRSSRPERGLVIPLIAAQFEACSGVHLSTRSALRWPPEIGRASCRERV